MRNLTVVILLLLFAGLGCGLRERLGNLSGNSTTGNSGSPSTAGSQTDAAPVSGDPRADVVQASKRFLDLPKFSAQMEGRGKTNMSMKLDYLAPDRYHMTNLGSSQQAMAEFIVIGPDMYMKFGGRWQKMPGAAGNAVPKLREMFNEEGLKTLQDVKYVGDEDVNGERAHLYTYRSTVTNANVPYPFSSKIWVGSDDGLPQRIEVTYDQGDLKTMTILYDYEKSISIEAPSV